MLYVLSIFRLITFSTFFNYKTSFLIHMVRSLMQHKKNASGQFFELKNLLLTQFKPSAQTFRKFKNQM